MEAWQKRYLVLRDSWSVDSDTDTSLELYSCSDTDSSKCHTVSLRHVMFVDVYQDSKSFPHAFIVFRSVMLCADAYAGTRKISYEPTDPIFTQL